MKKLISVALVSMLLIAMLPTTALAAMTLKITWNANGGKIGSAKTATTYAFEGGCTAESGGMKVSEKTKIAAKNTKVYAQWKKAGGITPAPSVAPKPTPAPTPAPMPTPLWDYWLFIGSSNVEHGSVWVNGQEVGSGIGFHFHNSNPLPLEGFTVEALPKEGFRFDGWYEWDKLVTTESPYSFSDGHVSLIAQFSRE